MSDPGGRRAFGARPVRPGRSYLPRNAALRELIASGRAVDVDRLGIRAGIRLDLDDEGGLRLRR